MSLGMTALVLNTETMAITGYNNYEFIDMSTIDGVGYAVKEDGIYILEGDTDNGTVISSEFLTGQTDLDQDRLKSVSSVHADITGDCDVLVAIDGAVYQVPFNGRARIGKGIRGNRLAFGLKNKNSSRLSVNSLEPIIEISKKRAL